MILRDWTSDGYRDVARVASLRTGLRFGPERRAAVEAGIRLAMDRASLADPRDFLELLLTDPKAMDELAVEITGGESAFYRRGKAALSPWGMTLLSPHWFR